MNKVTREDIARVLSGEIPVKHGAGILAAANSIRGNKTVSEGSKKGFSGWGEVSEIIGVVNTKEYILKVFFENGAIREIDLSNYIKCSSEPTVIKYQEKELFETVDVVNGNASWGEELELTPEQVLNWKETIDSYFMIPIRGFQDNAIKGAKLIAKQLPVTLNEARAQFLWINKEFPSKEEALKFVNSLSDEEYAAHVNNNWNKRRDKKK